MAISNRIFEMRLYNYFLSIPQIQDNKLYDIGSQDKNHFINNGKLNMKLVLQKFVEHFNELYGDQDESFLKGESFSFFTWDQSLTELEIIISKLEPVICAELM